MVQGLSHGRDHEHCHRLRPAWRRSQRPADRPADRRDHRRDPPDPAAAGRADTAIPPGRSLTRRAPCRTLRAQAPGRRVGDRPRGTVKPRGSGRSASAGARSSRDRPDLEALDRIRGRYGLSEVDVIGETVRQIHDAPPFPAVPLVVITGGRRMRMVPQPAFEAHQAAQRRRIALSPDGRQVIATGSGHFPHLHEPEIVIEAIRDLVARCRG